MKGFAAMAQRIENAQNAFVTFAMETAGLTNEEARRALRTMRKARVLEIDVVGGQFTFTHGAFAQADVIRRAAQEGR